MTDGVLAGLHVLNTRPVDRAAALDAALAAAGARISALPLLELEPLAPDAAARAKIIDLDRYRVVFVVSPTAAELGLALLGDYWPQWPAGQAWVAVGAATARVLEMQGLSPLSPSLETSEGVLALPPIAVLQPGDRVLVLRGEGGRNLVRDWLQAKSVTVDYLDLYRRRLPDTAGPRWRDLAADGAPDVVVLTSGESLGHWLELAGGQALAIPALVISERLAALAGQRGIRTVITARDTRPDEIVTALRAWRKTSGHGID
ncbi:MAG TPA: uroporphyrinogen-III synthase [Fluviicoccus sp.]|nr:uroporphyrinogen-III synthase [Fluviicoccus sp.]